MKVEKKYRRKPDWLKIKLPGGANYTRVKEIIRINDLNTICTSGKCPNSGECWNAGTATFMILGDICTRSCSFCAVKTGKPLLPDPEEPYHIAKSIELMGLKHVVLTSVDRDDLPDGGVSHWVDTINAVRKLNPEVSMEVLIPDFSGKRSSLMSIIKLSPEIISHNMETIQRLTPLIRNRAEYQTSLEVIKCISENGIIAKSGLMLGLGEKIEEVTVLMEDLLGVGCSVLTIGQYLQPSISQLDVVEYVHPNIFESLKEIGLEMGFVFVESSPLVRSSYHAEKHVIL